LARCKQQQVNKAAGSGAAQVARFLPNPEKNWGPKPKHGRTLKVMTALP
jgi:hypothetical protein